ncbi:hypothetical protein LOK74_05855 [Brevibacillus humidisoli]|uniref:hypothetical protein n=1 Tax=Brevibacillus humidisoli TaxID=2895522 RepID=UPI001E50F20C|nr:hypothetical protein [Brevibacillus humidisoli]UFJ42022.1 hypothetical protein LOK74_05855 [Brevibacillus humidisoli]
MAENRLAIHEAMDVSELLNFKSVCLTRSTVSQTLVSDETLKQLLQQDVQNTQRHIQELQTQLSQGMNVDSR